MQCDTPDWILELKKDINGKKAWSIVNTDNNINNIDFLVLTHILQ